MKELFAELYLPVGNLAFSALDEQPYLDELETDRAALTNYITDSR